MFEIGPLVTAYDQLPQVHPEDKLGPSLEHTKSSHDIVLVFEADDVFLGILAPSFAYFKKRYPNDTKVKTAMIVPPHLQKNSTLFETSEHMLSTGAYTLPLFDDHTVSGLITARAILAGIVSEPVLLSRIKKYIKPVKPYFIAPQTKIRDIYNRLKNEGSRIIVVNNSGAIEGIITRRDVQNSLVVPSRRTRFMKGDPSHQRTFSFDEEKIKRLDYYVTELYNSNVITMPEKSGLEKIIQEMLDKNVNSIVLVNFENKPTEIISVRTVLEAIVLAKPKETVPLKISDQHNILSSYDREQIENVMTRFTEKVKRFVSIQEFSMDIDASPNRNGKFSNFEVRSNINSTYPGNLHSQANDKNLMKAVKSSIRKIENQLE